MHYTGVLEESLAESLSGWLVPWLGFETGEFPDTYSIMVTKLAVYLLTYRLTGLPTL
jgi:hypothetical protein